MHPTQPTTAAFAVPGKTGSMYGLLKMMNSRLYPIWDGLEDALVNNRPQNESKGAADGKSDPFVEMAKIPGEVEKFALAMEGASHGMWVGMDVWM